MPRTGEAPALIAVAHGSRDPRSAATMSAVVAEVAAVRPDLTVRLAFLDLSAPSVDQVIDAVAAEGHTAAVVVPLLLGSAFHARVDLPALLSSAGRRHPRLHLTQADVLGPDPRLIAALCDRITETPLDGPTGDLGIAVAAVGSSSDSANRRTAEITRAITELTGHPAEVCFATAAPSVVQAKSRLHARGARNVVLAPWFLAPGLLTDRLRDHAPDIPHAPVIGAHPALTAVVLDRYARAEAIDFARTA